MKPYSLDLREKIIEAYQNSEGSQRQLARRFKVSLGFIQNLWRRYRQDGTLEPRLKQNGFKPHLAAHESLVKELVEQFPDATLKELTALLAQRGIRVSVSTVHYYLERLKLTRKKKLFTPSKLKLSESKTCGWNIGSASAKSIQMTWYS
jgi:transposase